MGDETFQIQYSESPEVNVDDRDPGVVTITTTKIIIETGTVEQLSRIVTNFVKDGEEVEVQIKHKPTKE